MCCLRRPASLKTMKPTTRHSRWPTPSTVWTRLASTFPANLSSCTWTSDLSHLHKKTYARFHAAALQYNFVIQNKTGSGVPLHLRTTSPTKINAMAPDNPKLLQTQEEDPDLQLIKRFRMTKQWPSTLHPDHKLKLKTSIATC